MLFCDYKLFVDVNNSKSYFVLVVWRQSSVAVSAVIIVFEHVFYCLNLISQ